MEKRNLISKIKRYALPFVLAGAIGTGCASTNNYKPVEKSAESEKEVYIPAWPEKNIEIITPLMLYKSKKDTVNIKEWNKLRKLK